MRVGRAARPRGCRGGAAAVREQQPSLRTRLVYTLAFLVNSAVLAALLWTLAPRQQPPAHEEHTEKALDSSGYLGPSGDDGGRSGRAAAHPPATDPFVDEEGEPPLGQDPKVTEHPIHRARTTHRYRSMSYTREEDANQMTTASLRTSTEHTPDDATLESTLPTAMETTGNTSTNYISEDATTSNTSSTVQVTTSAAMTNLSMEAADQTTSYTGTTTEETFSFDVDSSPSYDVVCYFNHTSYKRDEPMSFRTGHIPVPYCSHIIYDSVGVSEDFELVAKDPVFDVERGGFTKFARLKSRYRHVTVMVGIGEDIGDSNAFGHMSNHKPDVVTFARHVASWLRQHDYDGVVLQWKMPVQRQDETSSSASWFRKKLLVVAAALRDSLGAKAELFVAVPNNEELRQAYFNVAELARHVDRFLAVSNWVLRDVDGTKNRSAADRVAKVTSFPDPLTDVLQTRHSLVGAGNVQLFRKFCFVLSVGARSYTLLRSGHHVIHAAASGPGKPGPYTRQPGVLAYYEFCNQTWLTTEKGTFASYVARDDQWVGYLDVSNVQRLLRMALYKHRAACLGIWDVSLDDFRGVCGDAFPYVKAISGWHDREWKHRRREFGSRSNK
ncbi:chitinase-3-like protein 1 [Dermacentor albipictus]|uniref:chitinase-3-like protein 1 n=1 Tax=Dermacentor albipictus TaxID=60249 RepID=UPI0031FD0605